MADPIADCRCQKQGAPTVAWLSLRLYLHRVTVWVAGITGHVEPQFHQVDGSIVILVKLQSHLVLACRRVGHVCQRNFKNKVLVHFKIQGVPW